MINTPVSAQLECLTNERIHHSLFISHDIHELHLWNLNKLKQTLELLQSRSIEVGSIIKMNEYYLIKF